MKKNELEQLVSAITKVVLAVPLKRRRELSAEIKALKTLLHIPTDLMVDRRIFNYGPGGSCPLIVSWRTSDAEHRCSYKEAASLCGIKLASLRAVLYTKELYTKVGQDGDIITVRRAKQ